MGANRNGNWLLFLSVILLHFICFAGAQTDSFTFQHISSTDTTISLQVLFQNISGDSASSDGTNLVLRRDGIIIASETFSYPAFSSTTFLSGTVDDGGFLGTSGSGLEPGTSYVYSLTLNGVAKNKQTLCTKPAALSSVGYYPVDTDTLKVYFHPNANDPGTGEVFEIYVNGSFNTASSGHAREATVDLVAASAYSYWVVEVYPKEIGCAGPPTSFTSNLLGSPSSIASYTAPEPSSIQLANYSSTQSCISFSGDMAHLGKPGIIYKLYRDGQFITDVTSNSTDCGLEAGTQYEYQIYVTSSENGAVVASAPASQCTQPSTPINLIGTFSTDSTVTLGWSSGGGGITGYYVWDNTGVNNVTVGNPGAQNYTFYNLLPGQIHTMTVKSYWECPATGLNQTDPNGQTITLYTAPSAPTLSVSNINLNDGGIETSSIFFTLTAGFAINAQQVTYTIYKVNEVGGGMSVLYSGLGSLAVGDKMFLNESSLEPAHYYAYYAVAHYQGRDSASSGVRGTCTYPEEVTNLQIQTFYTDNITITWSAPLNGANVPTSYSLVVNGDDSVTGYTQYSYNVTGVSQRDAISFAVSAVYACPDGNSYKGRASTVYGYLAPNPPIISTGVAVNSSGVVELNVVVQVPEDQGGETGFLITRNNVFLTATPYTTNVIQDSGLVPGFQYEYVAYAIQHNLTSRPSAVYKVCPYPSLPTGVRVVHTDSTSVTIQYEPPSEGRVDGFLFTVDGDLYTAYVNNATSGTHTISHIIPGAALVINVQSYVYCDMSSNGGASTILLSDQIISLPTFTTPVAPVLSAEPTGETSIQINFDTADSEYTYHIWRDEVKLVISNTALNSFDDSGLTPGMAYTYKGAVEKNGVISEISSAVIVYTYPPSVTNLEITAVTKNSITVTWINHLGTIDAHCLVIDGITEACRTTAQLNTYTFSNGLMPDTAYSVKVFTYVLVNSSPMNSSETSVEVRTTMGPPVIEVAPGDTPGSMTINFVDGVEPVFRSVYRLDPDGRWQLNFNVTQPFIDTGLQMATQYSYTATYVGANGVESEWSATVVMCTNPEQPVSIKMSTIDPGNQMFVVTWGQPTNAPTYYNVFIGAVNAFPNVNAISQDLSSQLSGFAKTYFIQVESVYTCTNADRTGYAAASEDLASHAMTNMYVDIPPAQPLLQLTTVSTTSLQVKLIQNSQDTNQEIVRFNVFRRKENSMEQGLKFMNASDFTPLVDTDNLMPGTHYNYYVYAYYKGVESARSEVVTGCTNPIPPTDVRWISSTKNSFVIAWNSPSSTLTDYEISIDHGTVWTIQNQTGSAASLELTVDSSFILPAIKSGTQYGIQLRSVLYCNGDNTTKYSNWTEFTVATRPTRPRIVDAVPVAGMSGAIQINVEIFDELPNVDIVIFANGDQVAQLTDNFTFTHTGLLAGVQNQYTAVVIKHGLISDVSSPLSGCSWPGVPKFAYFTEGGTTSVDIAWTYPHDSATQIGVSSYDVYLENTLESDNQAARSYSKSSLTTMQELSFYIATNIICDPTNRSIEYSSISYEGGLKMVSAYTTPQVPVPYFVGQSTASQITIGLANPGSNSWGIPYDRIRVFRFGVEVNSQVSTEDDPNAIQRSSFRSRREAITDPFIYIDSGLDAARLYEYDVEVTWNGLTAYSANSIATCTYPNVVRYPKTMNRYWYGIDIEWEYPLGNEPDSFEIKIDISGEDSWLDVGYVDEYSLRSADTPDDFSVSGTTNNLQTVITAKTGFAVKSIQPNTVYNIQIRSVYACSATGTTLYGDPVSVIAETAPYPPKLVQLEPKTTQSMQITWDGIQAPELTYDVMECTHDLSNCSTVVAANLTTDNYLITGLSEASMYCYEVVARWKGLETRARDRYLWLDDYDYQVSPGNGFIEQNAQFDETQLTWTNYTHAYFDALCSCTYAPEPINISWSLDTSSSVSFEWNTPSVATLGSLSSPKSGQPLTLYNVAMHSQDEATEVELDFTQTSHIFSGFDPLTSHVVGVKTRLVCPDRRTLAHDAQSTVIDSPVVSTTAWTRPTTVIINETTQQPTNPDEEIRVDFSTVDEEYLFFQMKRDGTLLSLNDTTHFLIDTELTPGTVYQYIVSATYYDSDSPQTLVSVDSSPVEQCTLPADVPSLNRTNQIDSNAIVFTWTAPVNNYLGYNYTTNSGNSYTFTTDQTVTLSGLRWCNQFTFKLYTLGYCGNNGDVLSENAQVVTGFVAPENPSILDNSTAVSKNSIIVRWYDPNVARNCDSDTYAMLYRNGSLIYNSSDLSVSKFIDTGLTGATLYSYTTQAAREGELSPMSSPYILCTEPDPINETSLTCVATDTLKFNITWQGPVGIQASGYDLDISGSITRDLPGITDNFYEITVNNPGAEYMLNVTVTVLIDCPRTSGGQDSQSSANNPVVPISCFTYPQEITFTKIEGSDTFVRLNWTQEGSFSYYTVSVTPVDSKGEQVQPTTVQNITAHPYVEFSGLDSGTQYNIEIINYYQGYASNPTTYIHNPQQEESKLLGQSQTVGGIIIGVIVLGGLTILSVSGYVIFKMVKSPSNTPLKGKEGVPQAW